ncbi:MAG TPA: hypothetical protein VG253_11535 [Streptosporangiaceae bacterium]|nr:hypothetical protein [Streptosporangiaceae bacterium]
MAVWDELRVILAGLRDDHPSPLLQWPDPREDEVAPAPYQITLEPWATAVAERLQERFGQAVVLTVGVLPYPPGREPDGPVGHLTRMPSGELLDPSEVTVELEGIPVVRSGQTLHQGLLVHNLTGQEFTLATNGQVTAVVVNPQTGEVIGGFAGKQWMVGISFQVAAGMTERIPLVIGTASFDADLGYTVPPGSWGIQMPLELQRDQLTREQRLTPVLPLTITA